MTTSFNILVETLKILTQNYNKSYTLVELTIAVAPSSYLSNERINQARVLETLILLHKMNLVVLNSVTDESSFNIDKIN
ncbi:hypothetical protein [uncultured Flavobacterium sp.]|uniref:hypothetical protein n=1 Tax=uncultured Flavobacterium sp. TaxID=165435 RepID=UPI003081E2DB